MHWCSWVLVGVALAIIFCFIVFGLIPYFLELWEDWKYNGEGESGFEE